MQGAGYGCVSIDFSEGCLILHSHAKPKIDALMQAGTFLMVIRLKYGS